MSIGERVQLALQLAFPAIMAQLSTIVMQYIDASMVGMLGAQSSAAIGLVSTTTWLMGGICSSLGSGFAVMVAHRIGARDNTGARHILRQAITFTGLLSLTVAVIGILIAPFLPVWLGGSNEIYHDAYIYFLIFACTIPLWEMTYLLASMLRSAGNMKVPSIVNVAGCILDVVFNYILIFVFDLGVLGAAIGTSLSILLGAAFLAYYVYFRSDELSLRKETGSYRMQMPTVKEALHIGIPIAVAHIAMCSAHIVSTIIVAPLGTAAIAANAFGITIEGLCYMPGYGIGDAATTLVGQSIGAKRPQLQRSFSYLTLLLGMAFMTFMGVMMYIGIPYLIPLMTPDIEVQAMTIAALRIEAFAEPLYAASIVAYSVFVGAGDTKIPCLMNLASIWLVRLPLAMYLVGIYGLIGFWIAMATELCFRGVIFLIRLFIKNKTIKQYATY